MDEGISGLTVPEFSGLTFLDPTLGAKESGNVCNYLVNIDMGVSKNMGKPPIIPF